MPPPPKLSHIHNARLTQWNIPAIGILKSEYQTLRFVCHFLYYIGSWISSIQMEFPTHISLYQTVCQSFQVKFHSIQSNEIFSNYFRHWSFLFVMVMTMATAEVVMLLLMLLLILVLNCLLHLLLLAIASAPATLPVFHISLWCS